MSERQATENVAGFWINYGKHDNGFWIDAQKVTGVRNIGKRGSGGSIVIFDSGSEYATGYPATQLVAMVAEARARVTLPAKSGDAR